jgi:hypothetical protein
MKRNYLQGKNGDCINALLVGCGFNLVVPDQVKSS